MSEIDRKPAVRNRRKRFNWWREEHDGIVRWTLHWRCGCVDHDTHGAMYCTSLLAYRDHYGRYDAARSLRRLRAQMRELRQQEAA